jgi:hypothetical protein
MFKKEIHLRNNQLKKLDKNLFNGGLFSLSHIEMGNNEIEKLDTDIFKNLFKLKYIHLENNKFKTEKLVISIQNSVRYVSFKMNYFENNINHVLNPLDAFK